MRSAPLLCVLALGVFSAACSPPAPLTVIVSKDDRAVVDRYFEFTAIEGLQISEEDSPADHASGSGFRVALARGLDGCPCEAGSYRIDGKDGQYVVHADDVLGLQYGLSQVLEAAGLRFFHPRAFHIPSPLVAPKSVEGAGELQQPEIADRALHLHTLHPIESYFELWEPSDAHFEGARRIDDWIVKNRGNAIQWFALDDILKSEDHHVAWQAHTRAIVDDAHARGMKTGISVQLFGKSNLQQAFDLLNGDETDPHAEMVKRWHVIMDGIGWDYVNLSFGEFSAAADPADFIAKVDLAYSTLQEVAPGTAMCTLIHVGNQPDLRVTYMGKTQLYYFLAAYADPHITPWIHSVMYFNLFEPADGAYQHTEFDEHRAFLLDHLNANQPVGYFPEAAYWIAFDNTVPTYLPLYTRSRWLDLHEIRARASNPLRTHTLFSSGWEWGYWQTDVATLRMGFKLPDTWRAEFDDMFAPWGDDGRALVDEIEKVGELEHDGLLIHKLAAYVAGRDQLIDGGKVLGIISQPDRVLFDELHAKTVEERTAFANDVLVPLKTLEDGLADSLSRIEPLAANNDPFFLEVRDGVQITMLRARYIRTMYEAVKNHADTGSDGGKVAEAKAILDEARKVVARRHAALWDPDPKRITATSAYNETVYHYGYLREANKLCFWDRERVEVERLLFGSTESQPACVL